MKKEKRGAGERWGDCRDKEEACKAWAEHVLLSGMFSAQHRNKPSLNGEEREHTDAGE